MEHLWRVLQTNAEWTRYLDAKALGLLGGAGVLGGFELKLVAPAALRDTSGLHQLAAWGSIFLAASAVLAAVIALTPRVKRAADGNLSHIFYGAIAKRYPHDFGSFARDIQAVCANESELRDQVANQIWEISRIASVKSTAVSWCARMLVLSLLLAGAAAALPGLGG